MATRATAKTCHCGARRRCSSCGRRQLVGHVQPRAGQRIEPRLGFGQPTCSTNTRCPRRRRAASRADPRLAQRFELYACGIELANGFAGITDAAEQRRRFQDAMAERQRRYGEQYQSTKTSWRTCRHATQ